MVYDYSWYVGFDVKMRNVPAVAAALDCFLPGIVGCHFVCDLQVEET
jgi:hypothetical protein